MAKYTYKLNRPFAETATTCVRNSDGLLERVALVKPFSETVPTPTGEKVIQYRVATQEDLAWIHSENVRYVTRTETVATPATPNVTPTPKP